MERKGHQFERADPMPRPDTCMSTDPFRHSCSLSLALTIHFLLTFGAWKTYSQLLQMHRLQCSTEPQLGHTFVNAIKRGRGNVKSRYAMNINKRMVAYSNHDRCCVAALLIDSASSKLASLAVA